MKAISQLILFIFFSTNLIGQQTDSTLIENIRIGTNFSPDYCYRTLTTNGNLNNQSIKEWRDSIEIPKLGFTAGFTLFFPLNNRFSIETGVLFSKKGEQTKELDLTFLNSPGGTIQPLSLSYNYHYHYLDIPLKLNYYILKKPSIFLSGGISTNLFLQEKLTSITKHSDGSTTINTEDVNSEMNMINLAGIIGLGFEGEILKIGASNALIRIEPIFRHSIISIIDAPINGYSYSFGINFGIIYNL
jgi:hypothetical protein